MIPNIPGINNSGQMPINTSGGPSSAKGRNDSVFSTGDIVFGSKGGGLPWWLILLLAGGALYYAVK
ncbi:hypothetical protein [Photobacterium halotolerans]|uniref:Uncharacterized protein n=1 Tax=Photobacterium halotolerans TaxID=265726 RepID=A0A7X5AT40_9GAMM|nr:hypothetical protein [Photobacterium halotolerans]NAW64520.1 hypothetical protein [Photobacterium halotolerans]